MKISNIKTAKISTEQGDLMKKIIRNTSTPEGKAFWDSVDKATKEVATWPVWKRGGINVSDRRSELRISPTQEHINNIKERLKSYKCSLCDGWLTPENKRPETTSTITKMCKCPKGTHNSMVPDVSSEDVEWLLNLLQIYMKF